MGLCCDKNATIALPQSKPPTLVAVVSPNPDPVPDPIPDPSSVPVFDPKFNIGKLKVQILENMPDILLNTSSQIMLKTLFQSVHQNWHN